MLSAWSHELYTLGYNPILPIIYFVAHIVGLSPSGAPSVDPVTLTYPHCLVCSAPAHALALLYSPGLSSRFPAPPLEPALPPGSPSSLRERMEPCY